MAGRTGRSRQAVADPNHQRGPGVPGLLAVGGVIIGGVRSWFQPWWCVIGGVECVRILLYISSIQLKPRVATGSKDLVRFGCRQRGHLPVRCGTPRSRLRRSLQVVAIAGRLAPHLHRWRGRPWLMTLSDLADRLHAKRRPASATNCNHGLTYRQRAGRCMEFEAGQRI
jgi:hypothetical protein